MSSFKPLAIGVNKRFTELSQHELFVAGKDTDELWATYIGAFPEGSNPIYKTNTEHECTCCRNFVKNLGNAVAIIDGKIHTVWDIPGLVYPYKEVAEAMHNYVLSKGLVSVLRRSEPMYGAEQTKQLLEGGQVKSWNHLFGKVAPRHLTTKVGEVLGEINGTIQVFQRGLEELLPSALEQVLELIEENALYRGQEHLKSITEFQKHLTAFNKLSTKKQKKIYIFSNYTSPAARFRNTMIGNLVVDLSNGVELEQAVRSFEKNAAPENYKRPKALITTRMVEDAMKTIGDLGLEPSLERRFANLSDVSVNNVLWVDGSVKPLMKGGIANLLMEEASAHSQSSEKLAAKAEDISIADFMAKVLPTANTMELFVSNKHTNNFVSITAPAHADTKQLFKWNNDFGWSYDGNITDSVRQRVAAAGGRVDGVLRFSHSWNYEGRNASLMDLHVFLPGCTAHKDGQHDLYPSGQRVGWSNRSDYASGGIQDVDYVNEAPVGYVPVENITFPDLKRLKEGEYVFKIHNWQLRKPTEAGFKAEIEFGGQVFEYEHVKPLAHKEWVTVAKAVLKNGQFSITHSMPSTSSSKEKWGIKTEKLCKVQTVMLSPNYWDDNEYGNKHWFFILEGCANDEPTRGVYNEYLAGGLEKHRKVFEILGNKTKCPVVADQLSGLGFSSTRGDNVLMLVKAGRSQKTYNIQF